MAARRRAAARKMKQLKNASKETDEIDNDEDIDEYGELNGEQLLFIHSSLWTFT